MIGRVRRLGGRILRSVGLRGGAPKASAVTAPDWAAEVAESGVLDADWYRGHYPDVAGAEDPAAHFVAFGAIENRKPNPYIDPEWYGAANASAIPAGMPPLVHYLRHGWREKRDPSPYFDIRIFERLSEWSPQSGEEPVSRFLREGVPGLTPPPTLDQSALRPSVEIGAGSALGGLTLEDRRQEILESGAFHAAWYRGRYPDLAALPDVMEHFVRSGLVEGRQPNPYFDPMWYAAEHGQAMRDGLPPFLHYLRHGWRDMRNPSPKFDLASYAALTGWSPADGEEPVARFMRDGLPGVEGVRSVDPERPDTFINIGRDAHVPVMPGSQMRLPLDFRPAERAAEAGSFTPNRLTIHWIVPDFAPGSGGHTTIFRMIRMLGLRGHRQTIWVHGTQFHAHGGAAYDTIAKHFMALDAQVMMVGEGDIRSAPGDVVIATDWASVWIARAMAHVKRTFYFVQDFEPLFYPRGAESLLADATYDMDVDCICASPWLKTKMEERGRWARAFHLAADRDLYLPGPDQTGEQPLGARQPERPRIAFYARRFTARRAVDLGLLALEELSRRGHAFFVDFFGANEVIETADYPFIVHGVRKPSELAALYAEATIGVVFSATNYSLVPQEMMASGLPLVELDVESTRAIYPDGIVTPAAVDPVRIADAMEALLFDPERRARQRAAASEWVAQFSWKGAADVIEGALTDRLGALGHVATAPAPAPDTPKVSVVIPTLDGGERLMDVLDCVKAQVLSAPFEILVIDSGSSDGTLERMEADPRIMVHRIDKSAFGHGRTRNLGVELTSGDYVAFLTQDALPVGDNWLADLVIALDHYPMAAGAFGRHVALPDADPFTKRDMDAHFRQFLDLPLIHARDTDPARWATGDVGWRQILHFYSDNSSILRRSVWKEIPMRDVAYGEDQLFARDIVEAGYQKIYVPSSVVEHSHDYDADETYERARTESAFFYEHFGYDLMADGNAMQPVLDGLNASDEAWALAHGIRAEAIETRLALNAARLRGHLDGRREAQGTPETGTS